MSSCCSAIFVNLSCNKITYVCPEIGQLQNLQIFYLSCNRIVNVCPEIGQLQNLHELYLSSNQIHKVCPEIGQLQHLQILYLSQNKITRICPEIARLKNLQKLFLDNNYITNICAEIEQLQHLQILYLSFNEIMNVCPEIGQLKNLQILFLDNNRITIIPSNIIQCNNLKSITYYDNNIKHYIGCVKRFLNRMKDAGGNFCNDVHVSGMSIQTPIKNSVFNLLNTHYMINETNEINDYIKDSVLTTKTKHLITKYICIKETDSNLDCTFEEIFKAVWDEISTLQIDSQNEVKKRLNEEIDDDECKCFTGRINCLINCLSGYSDKILIKTREAEQIENIISRVRSIYDGFDMDTIKRVVQNELKEHKFDTNIIKVWISYITGLIRSKYINPDIDTVKQIIGDELTEHRFDQNVIEKWISYIIWIKSIELNIN